MPQDQRPITFEFTLPSTRKVEIREIGPEDELAAFALTGDQIDTVMGKVRLSHAILRRAIHSIDGVPQTPELLEENKLFRAFSPRDFRFVQMAHDSVNGPVKESEAADFLKTRVSRA